LFLATAAFHLMSVNDQVRQWGFHWMLPTDGARTYINQTVAPSGRLQNEDELVETTKRTLTKAL